MPSPKVQEKRKELRYPLERLAKIQIGSGHRSCYCLITDISGGGVRINTFGVAIPDKFELLLSGDGPARDGKYEVIWRIGQDVGAKFVSQLT
jgi:PilZ domain-containing protein